jgi:hypothetical protein
MRHTPRILSLALLYLSGIVPAFASSCGTWDKRESARDFASDSTGTLALVQDSRYFVLGRDKCVNFVFGDLYFQINHNGASVTQPTFVSVHVALIKIGGKTADRLHLYRSTGPWNKDRSGVQYNSDHRVAHETFNQQIIGDQASFNQIYRDDVGRTWHDSVDTNAPSPLRFETWNYRNTFSVRQDLTDAIRRGEISVSAQNYLVSFTSRAKTESRTDIGSPPDFTVRAGGYDCAVIRVSGTSMLPEFDGEYMINQSRNTVCDPLISGFTGRTILSVLFGSH